jgi:flagellar biosynthesis GTPase FlhF
MNCYKTRTYFGSGIYILRALKEYRKENFKRKDLEFFSSKKEAFNAQEKYIKENNTLVINGGYNISPKGGHQDRGSFSEESKKKLSINNGSRRPEVRKKLSEKAKNRAPMSEQQKQQISKTLTNQKQSIETRQKRSKSLKGRTSPMKGKKHKKMICLYCGIEIGINNFSRHNCYK